MSAHRPPPTAPSLRAVVAVMRWSAARPALLAAGVACVLVAGAATLLLPRMLGRVAATLRAGGEVPWRATALLLLVQLLGRLGGRVALGVAAARAITALRTRLFARLVRSPMTFHDASRPADLVSVLGADAAFVQETLGATLPSLALAIPVSVGAAVLAAATSWRLTLAAAVAALPVAVVPFLAGRRLRALGRGSQRLLGELGTIAQETLSSLRAVKTSGWEPAFVARFDRVADALYGDKRRRVLWAASVDVLAPAAALGAVGVLVLLGTREVAAGRADMARLVAFAGYASTCGVGLLMLLRAYTALETAAGAATRFVDVLYPRAAPERAEGAPIARAGGALELDAVSFRWPGGRDALRDVTLHIAPGETVVLAGRNGAGKSTLVQLLLRLYEPHAGVIRLDGRPAPTVALADWRRQFAVVSRDPALFALSIHENVALGRPGASRHEVERAVAAVGLHEVVARLPHGYDTMLGDAGLGLSAGQRQCLALARAVLQDAPVVVLDEAMTSLDGESERRVAGVVREWSGERTVLVIAHPPPAGLPVSRVVRLENGRLHAEEPAAAQLE